MAPLIVHNVKAKPIHAPCVVVDHRIDDLCGFGLQAEQVRHRQSGMRGNVADPARTVATALEVVEIALPEMVLDDVALRHRRLARLFVGASLVPVARFVGKCKQGGVGLDRVLSTAVTRNFDSQLSYVLTAMIAAAELGPQNEVRRPGRSRLGRRASGRRGLGR